MICYVDGACSGNGSSKALGGYGVVTLDDNGNFISAYQHFEVGTTNNRQEMKAILYAMVNYGKKFPLTIYSDSAYAINTFSSWMYNWVKNNWTKSDNKTPENLDLVQAFYNLVQQGYKCNFKLIKGHSGIKWNELADDLATGKIKVMENQVCPI